MIPFKVLTDKIRELAAEFPDERAECVYFKDGVPECIVGRALNETVGVTRVGNDLVLSDGSMFAPHNMPAHWLQFQLAGFENPTAAERRWVRWVQSKQDAGTNWALAVAWADNNLGVV